jgi:predicted  nucleic acid-binding Zn-ribbon protein
MDRVSRAGLGALFNEMIVWYGRTRRHPVPPARVALEALEVAARGFEACKWKLEEAEAEVGRLRSEVEQLKKRALDEHTYRQQLEALNRQLEEGKAREAQLQQQLGQLRRSLELERARLQRLAQILCPHIDELKQLARNQRDAVELEALCWPREKQ